MKTQIRLNSAIANGVGGPEAGMIGFIYEFLLAEYGQTAYRYISINQIGDQLDEFIMRTGKDIHINIRYPSPGDFEKGDIEYQNTIRLDIVHTALLSIAAEENKLNVQILNEIKGKILQNRFLFDCPVKTFENKKSKGLFARLILRPGVKSFTFFIAFEKFGNSICTLLIYQGITSLYYMNELFKFGRWKGDNEFILTGKSKEAEIHVLVNECTFHIVNLTPYRLPPCFTMFRTDIDQDARDRALEDYSHSLPPAVVAMARDARN